jgi:hypothetical protein
MSRSVIAICIMFAFIQSAHAIECQTSALSKDHWAWRLIDGRKCWYKGAAGMGKSLLHWAASGDSDMLEDTPDKPKEEKILAQPEMRPIPPEVLNMLPILPRQPSFEDRWRMH